MPIGQTQKTDGPLSGPPVFSMFGSDQRETLPAFRQEVQTLTRIAAPLTVARTR